MSSTNRGTERAPRDCHQTPPEVTRQLLSANVVDLAGDVWEPCAGSGYMAREIRAGMLREGKAGAMLYTSDVCPGKPILGEEIFKIDITTDHIRQGQHLTGWGHPRLTVMTNPPYQVESATTMQGMSGELLDIMVPKCSGGRRDGVALTFAAAVNAGASQIVLGPIRTGWWMGAKCRVELRRRIMLEWNVTLYSMTKRPRFLDEDGVPAKGTDSCDYMWLIAERGSRGYVIQRELV